MYKVQSDGVAIYDLNGEEVSLVAQYPETKRTIPIEEYVSGDNLIVIVGKTSEILPSGAGYDDYTKSRYDSFAVYSLENFGAGSAIPVSVTDTAINKLGEYKSA